MLALRGALIGVAVLGITAAVAASIPLAGKPGLWQMTIQMTGVPGLPPSVAAHMTAAQRAAAAAEMAKPTVVKECLTAAEFANGFNPQKTSREMQCTHTVVAGTATSLTMQVACKSAHNTTVSGTFKLEMPDAEHIRGATDMTIVARGNTMHTTSSTSGIWLAADCGGLKPGEVR